MSRTAATATRPQQALQSYLDALLQEAAVELEQEQELSFDEFEAAVLEEQVRDARRVEAKPVLARPLALAEAKPQVLPTIELRMPDVPPIIEVPVAPAEPEVEARVEQAPAAAPSLEGRPSWAEEPFECLLFDVAGLTLAVPLVCLGTIHPLAGTELTPLFGQPDWFLGLLPGQDGNLKVLDTARWVMPERYREDFRDGLQYVISVQGYEWGLAVHQVSRSIRLDPSEIKWRSQRSQRPWLAGTVIEHMCALLDVSALAELIASGATRNGAIRAN
ncbi:MULTISPECIES: CheW domain-containing protein [unclassified Pseudomonas]|uniref:CheW domain-containing protein n=1 Tax=unclassified Pseudomonas TaxID=196821 RepID=UPI00244B59A3|nr:MULTISPECIES: CheW domain-containing protein [unclassified Pseudomonas]MDG9924822.1 chemotaxis protein CheW [Pseudomonas sp. GD04045]MDH0036803.1 chemotaxis protein CheW [Pseudomonas sp. GD04019]